MKIAIESTSKMVLIDGAPARIWEGHTENGVKVSCFIARVCFEQAEHFKERIASELNITRTPSVENWGPSAEIDRSYPSRLIL